MSALGLAALEICRRELLAGVHGGDPVRFRSPPIDAYKLAIGRDPDVAEPWCADAMCWALLKAFGTSPLGVTGVGVPPRTASCRALWHWTLAAQTQEAAPGRIFILDRGEHWHCGIIDMVTGPRLLTIEGDTNAAGSSTGDAWGSHDWDPSEGTRGRLVGYLEFGA